MSTPNLSPWGLFSNSVKLLDATVTAEDLTANANSQTVVLGELPENAILLGSFFVLVAGFSLIPCDTFVVSELDVDGTSIIPDDDFDIRDETSTDGTVASLALFRPASGEVSVTLTSTEFVSGTTVGELRVGVAYFVPSV